MIKYIGSKRRLVPVLARIAQQAGARSALDLFTGTTRVAQALKELGLFVTAVDVARYSEIFGRCYIETDAEQLDSREVLDALGYLGHLPGEDGYFTETFCRTARFVQPFNGRRVDAIRNAIERDFSASALSPILLTSLIEATDRVDSTTGVQMAFVKEWAPRSYNHLELRMPVLLAGGGRVLRADACEVAGTLDPVDLAYLDPPYNQHRYFTNYHVWETLVAWDAPEHYGIACKRQDARDESTKSAFNSKRTMHEALAQVARSVRCRLLVLSYNDESWVSLAELEAMCDHHDAVVTLAFDSARYVGARIGIHSPTGQKVGTVSHVSNREYVVIAGDAPTVRSLARHHAHALADAS